MLNEVRIWLRQAMCDHDPQPYVTLQRGILMHTGFCTKCDKEMMSCFSFSDAWAHDQLVRSVDFDDHHTEVLIGDRRSVRA